MSGCSSLKYFVGGVPSDVKHSDLYGFFKKYGTVKRITVFNSGNSQNKRLYGFCFVKFKKIFGGELDIENTEFIFQGRKLEIDFVRSRNNLKQSVQDKHAKRVFLQNVPPAFEQNDLLRVFSPFGEITNCFTVNRNSSSKVAGKPQQANKYGYVIFTKKEDAERLLKLKFVEVGSRSRIYVKRYNSTINRLSSEDGMAQSESPSYLSLDELPKDSGTFKAGEDKKKRFTDIEFQLTKPTARNYYIARSTLPVGGPDSNLRYNINML